MESREIPIKNYIILLIIVLSTVFITFHLANRYRIEKDYFVPVSPLYDVLYEVKIDELDNYFLENPNTVIYTVSDKDKDFDNELKTFVINNNLTNDIVLINLSDGFDDINHIFKGMISEELLSYKEELFNHSNMFVIKDRVISDLLIPKTSNENDLTNFFIKNGIM